MEEKPKEYVPLKEDDFLLREPADESIQNKEIENTILSLQKENLKVLVVCAGMLYGQGELGLKEYFKVGLKLTSKYEIEMI